MDGPSHYVEAERILRDQTGACHEAIAVTTAVAQVHATLALVAATVTARSNTGGTFANDQRWVKVIDPPDEGRRR